MRTLTERAGEELRAMADEEVATYQKTRRPSQTVPQIPNTVVAFLDDGRAQIRQEGRPPGVHGHRWCAPKYASLESYNTEELPKDPHPDVPAAFLHQDHVRQLTDQIHSLKPRTPKESHDDPDGKHASESPAPPSHPKPESIPHPRPTVIERTCIASTMKTEDFGYRVSAEAARRRFYEAPRRAVVADGEHSNWTLQLTHFPDFLPILDFIHLLTYLYAAAGAARKTAAGGWELYVSLLTHAWQGSSNELLRILAEESRRLGPPPENARDNDPTKLVADALRYVQNNCGRMNYPYYRKLGLPVTSCHIESMIKRFNLRVKASDKFWVLRGLDSILHLRAAWLSDGGIWQRYWQGRPQRIAASRRRYCSRSRAA